MNVGKKITEQDGMYGGISVDKHACLQPANQVSKEDGMHATKQVNKNSGE
jgi:hypothetical protein